MGITTLDAKDDNLAMALGGLTKGVTPLEMASAYGTFANKASTSNRRLSSKSSTATATSWKTHRR